MINVLIWRTLGMALVKRYPVLVTGEYRSGDLILI